MPQNFDASSDSNLESDEELLAIIEAIKSKKVSIDELDPGTFAFLVGAIFSIYGWKVQFFGGSTMDPNFDLSVRLTTPLGFDSTWIVKCKQKKNSRPVDLQAVRSLLGSIHSSSFQAAVLVTNTSFTKGALEFAELRPELMLVNGKTLQSWIGGIAAIDEESKTIQKDFATSLDSSFSNELVSVIQNLCEANVSFGESKRMASRLYPILANAELLAETDINHENSALRGAAIAAAFLSTELPKNNSSKLAIWHICSKILHHRLFLLPEELEEFYMTAYNDEVTAPTATFEWFLNHIELKRSFTSIPR